MMLQQTSLKWKTVVGGIAAVLLHRCNMSAAGSGPCDTAKISEPDADAVFTVESQTSYHCDYHRNTAIF